MLQKLTKFVKENIAAVVGIAAIVLSLLLMLLPGQFADLRTSTIDRNKLNGYEFLFNTFYRDGKWFHYENRAFIEGAGKVLPAAIAIIVLFVLSIVCFCFYKKSSAILMLGGLLTVVSSIFFFAMESNAAKKYGLVYANTVNGKAHYLGVVSWASYVIGAILLIAGAFAIYKSILMLKEEIKHPQQPKKNDYSYLK